MKLSTGFNRLKIFIWMGLFFSGFAQSLENPVQFMNSVVVDVVNGVKLKHDLFSRDQQALHLFLNDKIAKHSDFDEISQWIAGRKAWGTAAPQTKKAFIDQLKSMIIRTYARAVNAYQDQQIEFKPLRNPTDLKKNRVLVQSTLIGDDQHRINIDYKLLRQGEVWKVYDIIIEGVSLVKGYEAQFSGLIKKEGLEAAVVKIRMHNQS